MIAKLVSKSKKGTTEPFLIILKQYFNNTSTGQHAPYCQGRRLENCIYLTNLRCSQKCYKAKIL